MGNTFDAYLAGRIATEPTLGTTKDGRPWTKFRLAVDDRMRSAETGEWEKAQTIFHDVVAFGRLAERTFGTMHVGTPSSPMASSDSAATRTPRAPAGRARRSSRRESARTCCSPT